MHRQNPMLVNNKLEGCPKILKTNNIEAKINKINSTSVPKKKKKKARS